MQRKILFTVLAVMFVVSLISGAVMAAEYPSKPIKMIVSWSAGGGTDRVARALAPLLEEQLGESVAVLNRPGGTGVVGHTALSQARPDGYTIGFITPQLVTGPMLGLTELTYHDVKPLGLVNADPGAVTVKADAPWNSLSEFVDYAKVHPGEVRIGNSGPGGTWHMVAVSLERVAGLEVIHTPYNGAAPAITDVLGGHIEATTVSAAEVGPQVENGLLKMLAVTTGERMDKFPNVPTAIEQGFDLDLGTWRGLAVPNGVSDAVFAKLQDALAAAVKDQRFQDYMSREGFGIRYLNAEGFENFLGKQEKAYQTFYDATK